MGSGEARWPFIEAMHAACPRTAWSYRECGVCASRVNAIWPLVSAGLAAARADEREKTLREALAVVKSGIGFDASAFGTNYEAGVKRSVGVIEAMLSGTPLSYWLGSAGAEPKEQQP